MTSSAVLMAEGVPAVSDVAVVQKGSSFEEPSESLAVLEGITQESDVRNEKASSEEEAMGITAKDPH